MGSLFVIMQAALDDDKEGYQTGIAASPVRPAGDCGGTSESGAVVLESPCEAVVSSGCCCGRSSCSAATSTGGGWSSEVTEPRGDVGCERL